MSQRLAEILRSQYLSLVCRIILGVTFIAAGGSKIGHQVDVVQNVVAYNILPNEMVRPFAQTLPWLEVLTGLLLIVGLFLQSAGALLALLNVSFLIAIGTNLLRGVAIDCGCFGPGEPLNWGFFARDVGYLLMAVQVTLARKSFLSLSTAGSVFRRRFLG